MTPTDNEPVLRLFDSEGKFHSYSNSPDPSTITERELLEWTASLLEGETGLKTKFELHDDNTVTLSGDWLDGETTVPTILASASITGALGGFNAAFNGKGKAKNRLRTSTGTYTFSDIFGRGIF